MKNMKTLIGIGLVLISTLCYALITPLIKKASADFGPFTEIAISMTVLTTIAILMAFITEDMTNINFIKSQKSIILLLVVGVVNAIGFYLAIRGFKYMKIWQQQMFGILTPILSGIFAFFILGEKMSLRIFISLALMAAGIAVAFI